MYAVMYYPPGREEMHVFSCREKPQFKLSEEAGLHTLMVEFVPMNGSVRGRTLTTPAAHCLVETGEGTNGDG
jgi:hypothetical protein